MDWFRWHHGTVEDAKLRVVSRKSRVTVRDALAVWAAVLECGSAAEDRGSIADMDKEATALNLELETEQFQEILDAMQGRLLEGDRIKNWGKRQKTSLDKTAADRKRRQREREAAERVTDSHNVTKRDSHAVTTEQNREEKNREEDSLDTADAPPPKPKAETKGSRLAADWQPSDDDLEWAGREFPWIVLRGEAGEIAKFRRYWTAKGGADAAKRDWSATFRNWIVKASEHRPSAGKAASSGAGYDPLANARLAAKDVLEGKKYLRQTLAAKDYRDAIKAKLFTLEQAKAVGAPL